MSWCFIERVIKKFGDSRVISSYYLEFLRRVYVLQLVKEHCSIKANIVDLGAQPFILSCMLAQSGYEVTAVDIEPEPYINISKYCGVKVVRSDLEKSIDLPDESFDCAVLTEVIEHLNPYYISTTISEINRILVKGGILIITTPNIARLFNRIRLLLGINPIGRYHVREYTMDEIINILSQHGFNVIHKEYSTICDLSHVDCKDDEYKLLHNYLSLVKTFVKKPSKIKFLRVIAYPIVKTFPTTRSLIVVVANKKENAIKRKIKRW